MTGLTGTGCGASYNGGASDDRTLYLYFTSVVPSIALQAVPAIPLKANPQNAMIGGFPFYGGEPTTGQILTYDLTNHWWYAAAGGGGGITSMNGLSVASQTFGAVGTTGNVPAFVSAGSTHTLNIPMANASGSVTAGLISNAEWVAFNGKLTAAGGLENAEYKNGFFSLMEGIVEEAKNLKEQRKDFFKSFSVNTENFELAPPRPSAFFLFSESAWILKSGFKEVYTRLPLLSELMTSGSSAQMRSKLRQADQSQLARELGQLNENWWNVVEPLGGTARDMIAAESSLPLYKPMFPMNFLRSKLRDLLLKSNLNLADPAQLNHLVVLVNFLRASEGLNVADWKNMVLQSDDLEKSPAYQALRQIFSYGEIAHDPEWKFLATFLYPP